MTHLLLLAGGRSDPLPPLDARGQALALVWTTIVLLALWWIARRHERELRAICEQRVVLFPGPAVLEGSRPSPDGSAEHQTERSRSRTPARPQRRNR